MKNSDDILKYLKEESQKIEVPDSVRPEQMKKRLEAHVAKNNISDESKPQVREEKKKRLTYSKALAAAAGICIMLGAAAMAGRGNWLGNDMETIGKADTASVPEETEVSEETEISEKAELSGMRAGEGIGYSPAAYEDIYASMEQTWEKEYGGAVRDMGILEKMLEVGEEAAAGVAADGAESSTEMFYSANKQDITAGTTNVQTVGVDEGDIVKNDGRYLYQIIRYQKDGMEQTSIQIIDTKDGLKEIGRIEELNSIEEFYVWEDVLVTIENKYLDQYYVADDSEIIGYYDLAYAENDYHEISFYDLADRSQPEEIKTFTLQGSYRSSRIADGYFYGFSRFYANPGEGEGDYDAYVPKLDGKRLDANEICLPEDSKGTSYLVMVSIDLRNPMEFVQTAGIVLDSELYYVSGSSIYVTESLRTEKDNDWSVNKTALLRFSYGDGKFALEAEGEINGILNDTFSLDEYENHLRVVTTVWEYKTEMLTDDRTGEEIGSAISEERQTNAIYILDEDLKLKGKIEGLAEDEQIYSARFMGETGYFVTFRQTDPLFAVDLSDPENPQILSELKVSGFSEYLHFYGTDRLLGLGMEADEETGIQEGMKLSMFDITDPANVQEITRLNLSDYFYSEALYNHRAVLINPSVNLIGFEAEGSNEEEYWKEYLVFSYENDTFVQKLKLDMDNEDGRYYTLRGTFIGNTFYLLCGNGTVHSYDLNTGEQLESLIP